MSAYWAKRLLTAALREGLCFYAANVGERLAKKHIRLNPHKAAPKSKRKSRK